MFIESMEGSHSARSPNNQVAFAWYPGWNSPQSWNKFQDRIGENLYPEDPGVRLFEIKSRNIVFNWFEIFSDCFMVDKNSDKWLITPYWHLFGSEELSQRSEFIKNCMLNPYVMLNPLDAMQLNAQENMLLEFKCIDQVLCFPVKLSTYLPIKHIGLPVGFPGIPMFLIGMYVNNVKVI